MNYVKLIKFILTQDQTVFQVFWIFGVQGPTVACSLKLALQCASRIYNDILKLLKSDEHMRGEDQQSSKESCLR